MTADQTRQLGIEFERRVQTILPSTKTVDKIDTEDIYAFLNEYQNQFVKELYITRDRIQPNSNASNRIDDYLKSLMSTTMYNVVNNMIVAEDFNMYIDSTSDVEVSYSDSTPIKGTVSNDYINTNQLKQIQRDVYDKHRILRRPIVYMIQEVQLLDKKQTAFGVISDEYTKVTSVNMRYIKTPTEFTILGEDIVPCELPYECFNELVSGAVQLFINYKRGGASQAQTASKQPQRQSNQQNNQQDEQEDEE